MKAIINDKLPLSNVYRINETMEENLQNKIVLLLFYSQGMYENIRNFFTLQEPISEIKILNDNNEVRSIFTEYNKFEKVFHHYSDPETIEIVIRSSKNE